MRETSGPIVHPHFLWGWTRVDVVSHPSVKPLYEGAPDLGWTADERLCLYKSDAEQSVILVRLEADGEYRMVCRKSLTTDERLFLPGEDHLLGPAAVNALIKNLIAHDTRRGFDAGSHVIEAHNKIHRANWSQFESLVSEEVAPRLAWALARM